MTIIWPCQLSVEEYAAAGREVVVPRPCCPVCGSAMMFWSGYPRWVRSGAVFRIWVKRGRCPRCVSSDALLPSFCLVGRLDTVEVIGPALAAVSGGGGYRRVAEGIGELFAHTTVRGWWRRHRERGAWLAGVVAAVLAWWAPGRRAVATGGTDTLATLEGWGVVVGAGLGIGAWPAVSVLLGGAWLSATTNAPTTVDAARRLMTVMASLRARTPP